MGWAILDTAVYIDHWEHGRHELALAKVRQRFVVRHSAVVLSELRRGARTSAARRLVEALHRLARVVWEPAAADWWDVARLIRKIGDAQSWDVTKRREFQNDGLIALTARRHGATLVTTNVADFELLARELKFSLMPLSR